MCSLNLGSNFFAIPLNSTTYRYMYFHCVTLPRMFPATEFKNYFLEFATCIGNYSGTVEKSRHYSITVLLSGNQHDDHSFFSFCDSVFNGVGI